MMDCKEFKTHIDEYLLDFELDWKVRYDMDDHLLNCEKCQLIHAISSLMTDESIMVEPVENVKFEILKEKADQFKSEGNYEAALQYLQDANLLRPHRKHILERIKDIKEHVKDYSFRKKFIEKIRRITSDHFFPCTILSLYGVRSGKKSVKKYKIDDPFIIQLDIPADMEGHLTVLHYDEKNNLNLAFPKKNTDDTHVKAAEEKWIEMKASAPIGKHYLKAILSPKRIVEPNNIDFDNSVDIADTIEKLIAYINEISKDEWRESVSEFEVAEN